MAERGQYSATHTHTRNLPVAASRHGLGATSHLNVVHGGSVDPVGGVDSVVAEHAAAASDEVIASAVGA